MSKDMKLIMENWRKQQLKGSAKITESLEDLMKDGDLMAINQAIDLAMSMGETGESDDSEGHDEWIAHHFDGDSRSDPNYEAYREVARSKELGKWLEDHGIPRRDAFGYGGPKVKTYYYLGWKGIQPDKPARASVVVMNMDIKQ